MTGMLDSNRDALPDSADTIVVNGEKCPGKCTVQTPNSPRGWDERNGYGMSGATLAPKGDPLATFKVLVEVWKGDDYVAWKAFAAKYFSKTVKNSPGSVTPKALGIYHPELAAPPISISSVVVLDFTSHGVDDDGLWSGVLDFKEYRKPIQVPQKPVSAIAAAGTTPPTAQTEAQKVIQERLQTIDGLQNARPAQ